MNKVIITRYSSLYLFISILIVWIDVCLPCGQITHIEIGYRALFNYHDERAGRKYDQIARLNQDALEAGNAFPDVFYPDVCFSGKYHDVSEDTHWTPFVNVTINYIRSHYPHPWDKSTKKLLAFLLGIVSHQVADVSWHSLGIQQGFLSTMAYVNYNSDYSSAHADGDLGGEVLNLFQLDLSYSDVIYEWYIPIDDLLNIYQDYYGKKVIDYNTLETCSKIMYLTRIAERLALKKYFPVTAKHSPFILDNLYSYFLGGIEDMSAWTQKIWKHVTWGLEHGTGQCNLNKNPLYLRCNDSIQSTLLPKQNLQTLKNSLFIEPRKSILNMMKDLEVERDGRGVKLKPSKLLKAEFQKVYSKEDKMTSQNKNVFNTSKTPHAIYSTNMPYAKLGRSFAVADLDSDGNEDLVIGSPGFFSSSGQQSGCVFILFGTDNGLNVSRSNISDVADIQITGADDIQRVNSHFGTSLSIVDIDQDGSLDIAVGAPSWGSNELSYKGAVYIFSLKSRHDYFLKKVFYCKKVYCNFGNTMTSGDWNSDSYNDLIVGSPFTPAGGPQRGVLSVLISRPGSADEDMDLIEAVADNDQILFGRQNYSWFGSSIDTIKAPGSLDTLLVVGEPNFRNCSLKNCSYNKFDNQAIGRVSMFKANNKSMQIVNVLYGKSQFDMLGAAVSIGQPFGDGHNILAVAATGKSVLAKIGPVSLEFPQVGAVYLYNLSNPMDPISVFNGDRRYGRFGATVKFADINGDSVDDLIIGAPLRTDDVTEELTGAQQGKVFIYFGGSGFPVGDATSRCSDFTLVKPCPEKTASLVLSFQENFARFGSQFAIVKTKRKTNLLVTAEHSSHGARLSGAVAVFEF